MSKPLEKGISLLSGVMKMTRKKNDANTIAILAVVAVGASIIAIAIAATAAVQSSYGYGMMRNSYGFYGTGSMASMMNAMHGSGGFGSGSMMKMMSGNFVHDQDDINWMKKEMKEHMNFTDEDISKMIESCPMMSGA